MHKPPVGVVAALIFDKKNRILITQRHADSHLGGLWEFPGGRIERNEFPRFALAREIKEEVDIDVTVHNLFWRESVSYDSTTVDIRFYLAELDPPNQEVTPLEVADFRWVYMKELADFEFPKADQRLIRRLIEYPITLRNEGDSTR